MSRNPTRERRRDRVKDAIQPPHIDTTADARLKMPKQVLLKRRNGARTIRRVVLQLEQADVTRIEKEKDMLVLLPSLGDHSEPNRAVLLQFRLHAYMKEGSGLEVVDTKASTTSRAGKRKQARRAVV